MTLAELQFVDYLFLLLDVSIIASATIYSINKGTSMKKCRLMIIEESNLRYWRYGFYTSIFSAWIGAFFTFVSVSPLRMLFHLSFSLPLVFLLSISLPSWYCKKQGYGGMCNCDLYKYNDFYPMVALGIIGTLVYTFLELTSQNGLMLLGLLIVSSLAIAFMIPEKEIKPLEYPPELLLSNVDEFQAFIMTNPQQRKLITLLKATCDFCKIQVDEFNRIPKDLLMERLRIFDLTVIKMDPILGITFNIEDIEKVPVPSTRIFDSGMETEMKEGVLSSPEIEDLLY